MKMYPENDIEKQNKINTFGNESRSKKELYNDDYNNKIIIRPDDAGSSRKRYLKKLKKKIHSDTETRPERTLNITTLIK